DVGYWQLCPCISMHASLGKCAFIWACKSVCANVILKGAEVHIALAAYLPCWSTCDKAGAGCVLVFVCVCVRVVYWCVVGGVCVCHRSPAVPPVRGRALCVFVCVCVCVYGRCIDVCVCVCVCVCGCVCVCPSLLWVWLWPADC